jgi:hypothetical protein
LQPICGETATFHAKFSERPLLSVMNVGNAAIPVLERVKKPNILILLVFYYDS